MRDNKYYNINVIVNELSVYSLQENNMIETKFERGIPPISIKGIVKSIIGVIRETISQLLQTL